MAEKEQWKLMPGETIVLETGPYTKDTVKWLVYLAIPTVLATLLVLPFYLLYYKLMNFRWILTDRRFIMAEGWLTRRATTLSLEKVQEVNRAQRFFERHLWHTLTVSIETAATVGTTEVKQVADDDPLPAALEAAIHKLHSGEREVVTGYQQPSPEPLASADPDPT
jgi:uncharacterized membrane protein YdbT with pleckstrin-like domain